jgi:alcohol dehydrogenase class IV
MTPTLQIPRAYFGKGALRELPSELKTLGLSRPLLVTDRGLVKCGVFAMVTAALEDEVVHAAELGLGRSCCRGEFQRSASGRGRLVREF